MNVREACSLILNEAHGDDGIVVQIRMGNAPARDRIRPLVRAFQIACESYRDETTIDRHLASSAFLISDSMYANVASWQKSDRKWPVEFIENDIPMLNQAIQCFFLGTWTPLRDVNPGSNDKRA